MERDRQEYHIPLRYAAGIEEARVEHVKASSRNRYSRSASFHVRNKSPMDIRSLVSERTQHEIDDVARELGLKGEREDEDVTRPFPSVPLTPET